ncbi:MAG: hypothetical protein ACK5M3_05615 [Dysgonomonas sp.]
MSKSGDDIEADFYLFFKQSQLVSFIKGTLYREGNRPKDADTEDAVVSFKTGLDGQFQDGEIVINVYVPNLNQGGVIKKDITRCRQIGNLIMQIVKSFTDSEYLIYLINIPQSFESEDIQQHFVNARIGFERYSE